MEKRLIRFNNDKNFLESNKQVLSEKPQISGRPKELPEVKPEVILVQENSGKEISVAQERAEKKKNNWFIYKNAKE